MVIARALSTNLLKKEDPPDCEKHERVTKRAIYLLFFYLLPSCPAGTSLLWKVTQTIQQKIYFKYQEIY